ncbi:MAG: hypothetical protein ACK5U2_08280 [Microcystis sp.]|jgi:hypothetical protein|uniref:hypothetical protein n=1 Tax=unclassified Microcystis TaxID=2643300 RepID=UPI0022C65490|nr:hypothetical protein [Microcystis sp. LE19-195.1E]MCZ8247433.1 hypothetical protein [Microcystis sp. LE19-195.1E]
MSRRFNNLEDVVNTFTEEQLLALPANNKYRKYLEWKRDPEKRRLPETSVPTKGRAREVALSPFGQPFDVDKRVIVKMTTRAFDKLADLGGASLYNVVTILPDTARPMGGFLPAKAILSQRLAAPRTVSASSNRITGRSYKTSSGPSYTIPFGRLSASSFEFAAQSSIALSQEVNYIITFTPERLRQR